MLLNRGVPVVRTLVVGVPGLTFSSTTLSKNGGAFTPAHNAPVESLAGDGTYFLELDTSDVDTVGSLVLHLVHGVTTYTFTDTVAVLPTVIRAKLSKILLAVKAEIIAGSTFLEDQVIISLRMNPPAPAIRSDCYALILPLSQFADQASCEGAGRAGVFINGRINVYVRNRNALDAAYEAESSLTDESLGILDKVGSIIDTLQDTLLEQTDPTGAATNALLAEPMKLVFTGEPKFRYEMPEWSDEIVELSIRYILDMKQTGE